MSDTKSRILYLLKYLWQKKTEIFFTKMICNGDPVFSLTGMPGKELKMDKKINRSVIRTGETDIKVHLIDSFPNHP